MTNNNNRQLWKAYQQTDNSPNKKYSLLPTVLQLLSPLDDKIVIDLGCGSGFTTKPLALAGSKRVIGIDNAQEQLRIAKRRANAKNIEYQPRDIFYVDFPRCDRICAPFVLNYASNISQLESLLRKSHHALLQNGKIVMVWTLNQAASADSQFGRAKFGAINTVEGPLKDEAEITIKLYKGGSKKHAESELCTLQAYYYTPETIEQLCSKIGFNNLQWHPPLIADEGIQTLGEKFWENYARDCGLVYATAEK